MNTEQQQVNCPILEVKRKAKEKKLRSRERQEENVNLIYYVHSAKCPPSTRRTQPRFINDFFRTRVVSLV